MYEEERKEEEEGKMTCIYSFFLRRTLPGSHSLEQKKFKEGTRFRDSDKVGGRYVSSTIDHRWN